MQTLLALSLALFPTFSLATYVPPVQRYVAQDSAGHNGAIDESVRQCFLDITLIRLEVGGDRWVMLVLWSDYQSKLTFRPLIPTTLMPLQEGATWTDPQGRGYSYKGGVLTSDDGEVRYEIDGRFLFPVRAEGRTAGKDGLAGSWLRCEF